MKQVLVIIIAVLLSTSLLGCNKKKENNNPIGNKTLPVESNNNISNTEGSSSEIIPTHEIKLVKKLNKTKYLLTNGIAILREAKAVSTSKGEVTISFPKVSGLINKTLEEKINKSIESDLENEVKNYVDEKDVMSTELYPVIELNANNLLSISLRDLYSPPLYGLLYRLTDGKRLYLKDIFTDGTDYVPLINQKIVEGILKKEGEEENFLSKPFSTIKKDQNFVLSEAALFIVFHPDEEGFTERNSVSIPLSEIDDYVDVTDRYSGTERKTQERQSLIIRKNNIFITGKSDIIKKSNGNVWTYYPQISGLRDDAFEGVINKTIKDGTNEVMNNKTIDSLKKGSDAIKDYIALVQMVVPFNHYGILCIERVVNSNEGTNELQQLNTVYTFDLINNKKIEAKDLLKRYMASKELQDVFTNLVRNNLMNYSGIIVKNVGDEMNYSFIMDKGKIYFINGEVKDEITIVIEFKENTISGISSTTYCRVPLKNIINGAPEDFFGW